MAFATMDDVVAALAAGQLKPFYFPSVTTVAGRLTDLNAAGVGRYGQMATPAVRGSGGTLHVDSDAGFPWFDNAGGGAELRLMNFVPGMQTAGAIHLYERVWSCSGMDATVATAQAITSFPSLTIPDSVGTGLDMFAEIYTQIGTTARTITAQYTNSTSTGGTRNTVAQTIGGTGLREVYRLIPMPLQGADTGVLSIASATLSASTGTAGNFGLVLAKKLCTIISGVAYGAEPQDFARTGMPLVDPDAALMFVIQASTTASGLIDGHLKLGEN